MNEILRDLINTGKVVSFIDDVIVWIEEEEEHDEIVEEVIKRLAENNIYMKPEKYKWKVREVELLEVVIRLEEIKRRWKIYWTGQLWKELRTYKSSWSWLIIISDSLRILQW